MSNISNPSKLLQPVLLMAPPFSLDNKICNNILMDQYKNCPINLPFAHKQFYNLYHKLSSKALIYLLPSSPGCNLQDLTFVANLGCYIPSADVMILSNFKSIPRIGEAIIGRRFFKQLGYKVYQPSSCIEGEADLKFIRDNIFLGFWGSRSDVDTFHLLEDNFDLKITTIQLTDPRNYHGDCVFLKINNEKALVATEDLSEGDIKKIEKVIEIIPIPKQYNWDGWTNSIIIDNIIYAGGYVTRKPFEKFMENLGFNSKIIEWSEMEKNGGALTCNIMHLNYFL